MKRFTIQIILVFFAFLANAYLSSLSVLAASKENFDEIHNIVESIDSVQTYHARLKVNLFAPSSKGFDPEHTIDSETEIYGETGKRMNIKTNLQMDELGSVTEWRQIFDTNNLWVQTRVRKINTDEILKTKVVKINIQSTSSDIKNKPFETIYWLSGIGIFKYKDLPGTLYQILYDYNFDKGYKYEFSNHIVFHGLRKSNEKLQKLGIDDDSLKEFLELSTRFSAIWVAKDTGLIDEYSIGESDKRPYIHTKITYISVNKEIPDHIFIYKPPEGVLVEDITSSLLEMNNN